jgi:hypothetical protein
MEQKNTQTAPPMIIFPTNIPGKATGYIWEFSDTASILAGSAANK